MPVFIYGLKCPIDGVIRYVGKSIYPEKRHRAHVECARSGRANHHAARWIRKVLKAGVEPELIILQRVITGERWQDIERGYIASAKDRGWDLTNTTAGGEGLDYLDPADDERYRRNLSASMKVAWNNKPQNHAAFTAASLKLWADPEIKARRVDAMRVNGSNPEFKAKMSVINREIGSRPEVKAAKSVKMKEYAADPSRFQSRLKAMASSEVRAKMAESADKKWADPARKAELLVYMNTPEYQEKHAAGVARRATPEYRAMMAEKTRLSWLKRRR